MATIKQVAKRIRLRADITFGGEPNPAFPDADVYTVTLRRSGPRRQLTLPFYHGRAICRDPEAVEVLDCLASDASGVDNARGFEDWCAEYGYDSDSRKAEATYRACESSRDKLRAFLGDDYEAVLSAERL